MTPKDQKMLKVLELLTTLHKSKQHFSHGRTEEEKHILSISKQFISDSGLTTFEFIRAVEKLSLKGYIQHFIIFDDYARTQMDKELKSKELQVELKKLESFDTKEISEKIISGSIADMNKIMPSGQELTEEDFKDEQIKVSELSKDGLSLYKRLRPDEIGYIFILPFRSLDRLLDKIETGMGFEDVEDVNIWYEPLNFRLHFGKTIFTTAYRNTPTNVHFILSCLFNGNLKDQTVDYESAE